MNAEKPSAMYLERLRALRLNLHYGDDATQEQLDRIQEELEGDRKMLRPKEKEEMFTIVDANGVLTDMKAPRWMCHLLNLRHKVSHILLKWQSPGLGEVFVLQVRSWDKVDYPGHLDISVGGHVNNASNDDSLQTAYIEMEEELGIGQSDLIGNKLEFKKGYVNYDKREDENYYNAEWRDVYVGEIGTGAFEKIHFKDDEVVGIYLCPQSEAYNLLKQKIIPFGNALERSLPLCLEDKSDDNHSIGN
ncbi:hypothetical protein GF337_13075 [candidate division KSB1 bacterium]|nr:hypothetical protein [candidate division KSB1 bacterium]